MNTQNQTGLAIELKNLSKSFDTTSIINNLNLNISPGEFVAIVGKSGCGKTTLLRLLAALDNTYDGEIIIDERINQLTLNDEIRLMFQDARLLPWKNVLDNVKLGLKNKKSFENAQNILLDVGLLDKKSLLPNQLSGGQKQRVALARALIHQPKLLLLDEPLGALDALTRFEMQKLIEALWKKYAFTTILVTHDINEAVLLADRVIILEAGQVVLDLKINLARPRTNLTEVAYYEQLILNRILNPQQTSPDYAI